VSICWYCHWGWSKPVAEIYQKAVKELDGFDDPLLYGPGHVVWSDENFDLAESCLKDIDEWNLDHSIETHYEYTKEEMGIVRQSLADLAALPMNQREIVPDDYDGENPQDYPPNCEVVKV